MCDMFLKVYSLNVSRERLFSIILFCKDSSKITSEKYFDSKTDRQMRAGQPGLQLAEGANPLLKKAWTFEKKLCKEGIRFKEIDVF